MRVCLLSVGLCVALQQVAQSPRLTFDVASIHPAKPDQVYGGIKPIPGGHGYTARNIPVKLMISLMYRMPMQHVTGGPAWLTDLVNGDHSAGGSSNAAAVAGYPNINVTAGFISGLPVGISFFGRAWSEPVLIRLAFAFEQVTKARQAPRFLSSIGTG